VVLGHDSSQIMKPGNVFVVLLGQVLMTNSKVLRPPSRQSPANAAGCVEDKSNGPW
jgi:hypothetical protein